jgi:hypothetical protein
MIELLAWGIDPDRRSPGVAKKLRIATVFAQLEPPRQFRARANIELGVDLGQVGLNGAHAHE